MMRCVYARGSDLDINLNICVLQVKMTCMLSRRERSRLQLGPEPVGSVVRDALNLTEAVATRLQHLVVRIFDMHSGSRILMVGPAC